MDNKTITLQAGALTVGNANLRRQALLYSAVALGVSFLLTAVNFMLSRQIEGTGGLAGMRMRTVLSSAQMLLTIASTVLLPFWDMGFYAVALDVSRHEQPETGRLLEGFYRFGRVLGFLLLHTLFLSLLAVVVFYGATMVYMLSPLGDRIFRAMEPIVQNLDPQNPDLTALESMLPHMIPLYITAGLAALAFVLPAAYRLRLGQWFLMDKELTGRQALQASSRVMKGKRWGLFKLDLQFWWYYLLQAVAMAVAYADTVIPGLEGDLAFFGCYVVSLGLQFTLSVLVMPRVQVSYAIFYNNEKGQVA